MERPAVGDLVLELSAVLVGQGLAELGVLVVHAVVLLVGLGLGRAAIGLRSWRPYWARGVHLHPRPAG